MHYQQAYIFLHMYNVL